MMTLVSYDVSTTDNKGKTRLRKVSKECQIMDSECRTACLK